MNEGVTFALQNPAPNSSNRLPTPKSRLRRSTFFELTISEVDSIVEKNGLSPAGKAFLLNLAEVRGLSGAIAVVQALRKAEEEDWLLFTDPTDTFELGDCLGEGKYGSVFRVREKTGKENPVKEYAAKRLELVDSDMELLRNEILAYLTCRGCDFTISLHRLFLTSSSAWLILEYVLLQYWTQLKN